MQFRQATAFERVSAGSYALSIEQGWDIYGNANGGYLMAMAARAMADAGERAHPVALNGHFLAPGQPGAASLETRLIKAGRRFATVGASFSAAGRPTLELLGSFGDLRTLEGPQRFDAAPPELPPPEACVALEGFGSGLVPEFSRRVDMRLHPEDAGFSAGQPSGRLEFRGWFRLLDDEAIDAFALLVAADAFPPTIFNTDLPVAWTPTVELTTYVRGVPEPGWLRCRFSTRFISGGFLEEDGELWDGTGRLVAQSRQLALVPRAPSAS